MKTAAASRAGGTKTIRIAVLVIALCLAGLLGAQSLLIFLSASLVDDSNLAESGSVGVSLGFVFVLGAAFALQLPKVSASLFGIAAIITLAVSAESAFSDLKIWGGVAAALAVMSWLGSRELQPQTATLADSAHPAADRPQARPASPPAASREANTKPPLQETTAMRGYLAALRSYASFKGRASRREYWLFQLGFALALIAALILDAVFFGSSTDQSDLHVFAGIVQLGHLLPSIAVLVRRLHDIDRTGHWLWIVVTGLGAIVLLVFALIPGTRGSNRFGARLDVGEETQKSASNGPGADASAEIERLVRLRDSGAISQAEFETLKGRIVS